jgi:hypothetical protein
LFAVGDLKDNPAPQAEVLKKTPAPHPEAEQDEDEDAYMQPPEDEMVFQGYRILPRDERPRGGPELYAMDQDEDLPEIALSFGPTNPTLNPRAIYDNIFKMDLPERRRALPPRAQQVTPEDFYQPQNTQSLSRNLGQTRGDVTRTRSTAPAAAGQEGWLVDRWADGQQRANGHAVRFVEGHMTAGIRVPDGRLQPAPQREEKQQPSNTSSWGSQRQPAPRRDEDERQPPKNNFCGTFQAQRLPGVATTQALSMASAPAMQKTRITTAATTQGHQLNLQEHLGRRSWHVLSLSGENTTSRNVQWMALLMRCLLPRRKQRRRWQSVGKQLNNARRQSLREK